MTESELSPEKEINNQDLTISDLELHDLENDGQVTIVLPRRKGDHQYIAGQEMKVGVNFESKKAAMLMDPQKVARVQITAVESVEQKYSGLEQVAVTFKLIK